MQFIFIWLKEKILRHLQFCSSRIDTKSMTGLYYFNDLHWSKCKICQFISSSLPMKNKLFFIHFIQKLWQPKTNNVCAEFSRISASIHICHDNVFYTKTVCEGRAIYWLWNLWKNIMIKVPNCISYLKKIFQLINYVFINICNISSKIFGNYSRDNNLNKI